MFFLRELTSIGRDEPHLKGHRLVLRHLRRLAFKRILAEFSRLQLCILRPFGENLAARADLAHKRRIDVREPAVAGVERPRKFLARKEIRFEFVDEEEVVGDWRPPQVKKRVLLGLDVSAPRLPSRKSAERVALGVPAERLPPRAIVAVVRTVVVAAPLRHATAGVEHAVIEVFRADERLRAVPRALPPPEIVQQPASEMRHRPPA